MKILRTDEVVRRTGLSRTTLWRRERQGEFPARRRIGENSVGWLESEIDRWIQGLPQARQAAGNRDAGR